MVDVKKFRGRGARKVQLPSTQLQIGFGGYAADGTPIGEVPMFSVNFFSTIRYRAWISALYWGVAPFGGGWTGASVRIRLYADRQDGEGEVILFQSSVVAPGADGGDGMELFAPNRILLPAGTVIRPVSIISGGAVAGDDISTGIQLNLGFID